MVDLASGQSLTNKEVLNITVLLAKLLRSLGVRKGDKISIASENRNEFILPAIAALYLGAVVAPFNHTYTIRELKHCINISKPKIIFSTPSVAHNFIELQKELKYLEKVVTFGPERIAGAENFEELLYSGSQFFEDFEIESLDLHDVAFIMNSSGATGLPKGVMLTHYNIHVVTNQMRSPNFGEFHENDVILEVLPMFHAYGFTIVLHAIYSSAKTVLMKKFEETAFLQAIERYKINKLFAVPPIILFLAKSPLVDFYDLRSVKMVVCGAAPISKEIEDIVTKRLKIERIRQAYGMTETSLGVTTRNTSDYKTKCVGTLVPGMICKVADLETGLSLGPLKEGELCFKGPLVMKGYYGDTLSTSAAFDEDGWLHSGDVGYYDEEESFYVVDRLKELIKYKGYQVAPAELEALLLSHPDVKDAGVVGLPDEKAGELPLGFVVKKEGSDVSEENICNFINGQVSSQKKLRGGVIFIDAIPKTPSGKILRRELRKLVTKKSKL